MDTDTAQIIREEYKQFCEGKAQEERLMTVFYRDVIALHCFIEVRNIPMHEVFQVLFDDPERHSS